MVRLKGFPPQYATFDRKTDALTWAGQTEAAIKEGRYFPTQESKRHTVADLIRRYRHENVVHRLPRQQTHVNGRLDWWEKQMGDVRLCDVTPALIAELRGKLSRTKSRKGTPLAAATVNRYLAAISHPFSLACREWQWLDSNPALKVTKLKEPRGRVRFLSDDERSRLLAACRESPESRLYPLVVLALSTGARQGELLGLAWSDVDLSRGAAVVHNTKNEERRRLPIAGEALRVLSELSRVRRIDSALIFAGRKSTAVFPRKRWEEALKVADVEDFRFHDLRHSAASYLAMNGATLAEIAAILGHKTLAMVKRYAHLSEDHTSAVVARMNERIFEQ